MAPDGDAVSRTSKTSGISKISNCRVPEMRAAFPGCRITYEIIVSSDDLWRMVGFCSGAFSKCGFDLQCLRCAKDGPATFRVGDNGQADLRRLEALFDASDKYRIDSWTTVIGRKRSAA